MTQLEDAIAFFTSRGLRAALRKWVLGDSVVVTPAHGDPSGAIEVFSVALYVVCSEGTWEVVNCTRSGPYDVVKCNSLMDACEVAAALTIRGVPDRAALIACARQLAVALGLPCPSDSALDEIICEILYQRGAVHSELTQLITRTEARDVLLARLQTFICSHAEEAERGLASYEEIGDKIGRAWFGAEGA